MQNPPMAGQRFLFGPFTLDATTGTLVRDGAPLPAGQRAIALLAVLVAARGDVVTKDRLIEAAWPRAVVEESNLSVQIAALRKLLGAEPAGPMRSQRSRASATGSSCRWLCCRRTMALVLPSTVAPPLRCARSRT
jgi:DNA-binding response OmpR family regulator